MADRKDTPVDPFVMQPEPNVRSPGRLQPKTIAVDSTRPVQRMRAHAHSSSATQSVASATPTVITFNVADYNPVGLFASNRFTIPTTGKVTEAWLIQGRTIWVAAAGGTQRDLILRRNGSTSVAFAAAAPNTLSTLSVSYIANDPSPGDFYELVATQDSGAPLNLTTTADHTFFEILHLW